eukprot:1448005-Ditylum_brightwellii.AAC.1
MPPSLIYMQPAHNEKITNGAIQIKPPQHLSVCYLPGEQSTKVLHIHTTATKYAITYPSPVHSSHNRESSNGTI